MKQVITWLTIFAAYYSGIKSAIFRAECSERRQVKIDDRKTIDIFRIDTGERVSSRLMAIEDAQESMFDDDRHKGKITVLGGN